MNRRKKQVLAALACLVLTLSLGTTAFAAKTVAEIGNKKYSSLQTAVDKVKKGQTIKLTANITAKEPLKISKSAKNAFTIDFANRKYKYTGDGYAIELKKGSVTLRKAKLTSAKLIRTAKGTKLTIPDGTYNGIMLTNWGAATITGGTFKGTGSTAGEKAREYGLLDNYGTMTIKGGTFKAGKNTTIENRGAVVISGGTFSTSLKDEGLVLDNRGKDGGAVSKKGATATVTGGIFTANSAAVHNCGSLTVSGGTFTSKESCALRNAEGSVVIKDGTFRSNAKENSVYCPTLYIMADEVRVPRTDIRGGTFSSAVNPVITCLNSLSVKIAGGTFETSAKGEAMLVSVNGARISVSGGRITGRNAYTRFIDGDGKITVGRKVKVNTKGDRKK